MPPSAASGRNITVFPEVGVRLGMGGTVTPTHVVSGVSVVDSRDGFLSTLQEFYGRACPEKSDIVELSLQFTEFGGVISSGTLTMGPPVRIRSTDLAGTYDPVTGGLNVVGTCGGLAINLTATYVSQSVAGSVTLTNGPHEETRTFLCTIGSTVSLPSGYWVDSVNGSDSNAGLTPALPKQTISAAITAMGGLSGGETIMLASGSTFDEQIVASVSFTVQRYGIGPRPIVNGFEDVTTGWTAVGEPYPHVYQRTHTPELDPASAGGYVALENGVPYVGVANLAACETFGPGAMVRQATSGSGPYTLYVYPFGGTDASSDGKLREFTTRGGIVGKGSVRVRGLLVRGSINHNGGINIGQNDATDAADIDDCIVLHGGKHNFVPSSGTFDGCMAIGATAADETSAGMITFYRPNGDGVGITITNSGAIQWPATGPLCRMAGITVSAFSAHKTSGGALGAVSVSEFGLAYTGSGVGVLQCTSFSLTDSLLEAMCPMTVASPFISHSDATPYTIARVRCYGHTSDAAHRCLSGSTGDGAISITDILTTGITIGWVEQCTSVQVHRWLHKQTSGSAQFLYSSAGAGSFQFTEGLLPDGAHYAQCLAGSLAVGTDYNVFADGTRNVQEDSGAVWRDIDDYLNDQDPAVLDVHSAVAALAFEAEANADRPIFVETAASAAGHFAAGPLPCRPGSSETWKTPSAFDAWKQFINGSP